MSSELEHTGLLGRRILVVDDDADTREMLAVILESSGATVTTAQSAAEAIAICAKLRPDLLISDIGLPGEDGFSLVRRLRELPSALGGDIPAIALTGYDSEADNALADRAGFSERLTKPVSLDAVLEAVARVLTSPSP
ncbi:MAG: response regulator [Polyangiaceae bacterium]